jgi:hypothetical protein
MHAIRTLHMLAFFQPSTPSVPNGHANKDITDKHSEQLKDDVEYRREWAEKVGLGFVVPRVPQLNAESIEQHAA